MTCRSPSELARMTEEREELLHDLRTKYWSKGTKAAALAEIRRLEEALGIEGKNCNES